MWSGATPGDVRSPCGLFKMLAVTRSPPLVAGEYQASNAFITSVSQDPATGVVEEPIASRLPEKVDQSTISLNALWGLWNEEPHDLRLGPQRPGPNSASTKYSRQSASIYSANSRALPPTLVVFGTRGEDVATRAISWQYLIIDQISQFDIRIPVPGNGCGYSWSSIRRSVQ